MSKSGSSLLPPTSDALGFRTQKNTVSHNQEEPCVWVSTKQSKSQQIFYLHFDLIQFIFQQRRVSGQSDAATGAIDVKHTVATWEQNKYQWKNKLKRSAKAKLKKTPFLIFTIHNGIVYWIGVALISISGKHCEYFRALQEIKEGVIQNNHAHDIC